MADRVANTPHEPGDIVRDPKTGGDYVIQTVASLAAGTGILVYATHLWNGSTQDFTALRYANLQFITVRLNKSGLSPDEVRLKVYEKLKEIVSGREDFIRALQRPEAAVFRDLLLLSSEVDETRFSKALIDLAEALVDTTRTLPSEGQVYQIFRANIDPQIIPDEFIKEFARRLAAEARFRSSRMNRGVLPALSDTQLGQYAEMFFDARHRPNAPSSTFSTLAHLRRHGLLGKPAESRPVSSLYRSFLRDYITTPTPRGAFSGIAGIFGELAGESDLAKIGKLLQISLQKRGARQAGAVLGSSASQRILRQAARAARRGEFNPVLDFILNSHLLGDLQPVAEKARRLSAGVDAGSGTSWLSNVRRNPNATFVRNYANMREGVDLGVLSGLDPVSGPSAVSPMGEFLADEIGDQSRLIAVDTPTFIDQVVGRNRFVFEGVETSAAEAGVADRLKSALRLDVKDTALTSVVMTAKDLRDYVVSSRSGAPGDLDLLLERNRQLQLALGDNMGELLSIFGEMRYQGYMKRPWTPRAAEILVPTEAVRGGEDVASRFARLRATRGDVAAMEEVLGHTAPAAGTRRVYLGGDPGQIAASLDPKQLSDIFTHPDQPLRIIDLPDAEITRLGLDRGPQLGNDLYTRARPLVPEQFAAQARLHREHNLSTVQGVMAAIQNQRGKTAGVNPFRADIRASSQALREGFAEGVENKRVAVAQLSDATSSRLVVAGSELGVPLQEQISRAGRFIAGTGEGGLLDIETGNVGGTRVIDDVSLRRHVDGKLTSVYDWQKGLGEAENLSHLANSLDQVQVIGTQSAFDFKELSRRSRELGLDGVAQKFEKASVEQAFDTMVYFQKAGISGNLSQQHLMHEASRKARLDGRIIEFEAQRRGITDGVVELHEAIADNEDLLRVMREYSDRFHATRMELLDDAAIKAQDLLFYGSDTRLGPEYGNVRRWVGLKENPLGGVSAFFQSHAYRDGQVVPGEVFEETFNSVNELLGRLNLQHIQFRPGDPDVMANYGHVADEAGSRWIRSLNPFSQKIWDPLDSFDSKAAGAFGAVQLRVEGQVRRMLPEALERLAEVGEMAPTVAGQGERNLQISQLVEQLLSGTEIETDVRDRVAARLEQALRDPREADLLLNGSKARFLDSRVGAILERLAQDSRYGRGNLFSLGMINLMDLAASEGAVKEMAYSPRLSFKLAGATAKADFSLTGSTLSARTAVEDLASKVILAVGGAGEGNADEAFEILKRATGDAMLDRDEISSLASEYMQSHNASFSQYDNYLRAVREMGFARKGDRFYRLAVLHGQVRDSDDMAAAAVDALRAKMGKFDSDFTGAQAQREIGERMISRAEGELPTGQGNLGIRLQGILEDGFADDVDAVRGFLQDRYVVPDPDRLDEVVPKNFEGQVHAQAAELFEAGGMQEFDTLGGLAFDARNRSWSQGAGARAQDMAAKSVLDARLERAAQLNAAKRSARPATKAAGVREFHRLVTEATSPASAAGRESIKFAHELNLHSAAAIGRRTMSKYTAPLLAVGGALALMSAKTPNTGRQPGEEPLQDLGLGSQIARGSEIPSSPSPNRVWQGEEEPFRLSVTFRGFISDQRRRDLFVRRVHDIISGQVEVRRVNSEIQDRRNRNHMVPALEAMREAF